MPFYPSSNDNNDNGIDLFSEIFQNADFHKQII
jgi:hypothetical protein